ncbi:CopM family metallochaperone [Falsiroseomonas sp. CW058]|uniref:CopM family metallochaperone n=1 Tax=Falsiroseomonas sp. CW058 TaxID=3388664 RepID=UPI003D310AA8
MSRLPASLALAAALAVSGGVGAALAQGSPHHGPHRATPVQAAPGQVPPSAEQMQQMMQMMGRMTPDQMRQMHDQMMQRMTPEQRAQMMQGMGGMMGGMMGGARPPGAAVQPQQGADPHAHGAPGAQGAATSPSTAAFLAANEKMHREMALQFTGDADRDFAAAMIPHHQGAIEMARIQIQFGRDPDMRRLAEAVIREQEREIAELRAFLARQR